jgi:hypothetical protein
MTRLRAVWTPLVKSAIGVVENRMTQIDSGSNLRSDLQYLVSFPIGCQAVVAAILQVIPT